MAKAHNLKYNQDLFRPLYVDRHMSISEISEYLYKTLGKKYAYSYIQRALAKDTDPRVHKETQRHIDNMTAKFDVRGAYRMYKRGSSLRTVAKVYGIAPSTLYRHILKYQAQHPDAKQVLDPDSSRVRALRKRKEQEDACNNQN